MGRETGDEDDSWLDTIIENGKCKIENEEKKENTELDKIWEKMGYDNSER